MKPKDKRGLLAELIILYNYCGYTFEHLIGHPLSYFDYNKVKTSIEELKKEKAEIDGGAELV
jgi:hypothetical protein